ncbi:MAG: FMN-binding protein [Mogibacterium sp.]|nr:FMN-binding protein [Mogibacterium sp.]
MKDTDIVIRIIAFALCIAAISGYNVTLSMREKDEEIAKLTAELEAAYEGAGTASSSGTQASGNASTNSGYKDGVYEGESKGYGDLISVELTVSGGNITDIKILSAPGEDSAYLSMAEALLPKMIEAQTTAVDSISGATMSSVGIINAASIALNQAIEGQ